MQFTFSLALELLPTCLLGSHNFSGSTFCFFLHKYKTGIGLLG